MDRLSEPEAADVTGRGLGDDPHPTTTLRRGLQHLALLEFGPIDVALHGAPAHGEVVPRKTTGGTGRVRVEERRVLAEDDGPVQPGTAWGMLHRPGGRIEPRILEGPTPGADPVLGQPARIFGERHDRPGRSVQAELAQSGDRRTGLAHHPGHAGRDLIARDAVAGSHHDHLDGRVPAGLG